MSETLDSTNAPKQRPTFLTVLCILTFIGSGIGIISGVWNYFSLKSIESQPMGEFIIQLYKNMGLDIQSVALGSLLQGLLAIGTLFGALQMWKLKKTGFYIYAAATVVSVIITFVLMGGFALGGLSMIGVILGIAWIVMYYLNVKHME